MNANPDLALTLVEWVDSAQPVAAWHYLADLPALEVVRCRSIGWIVGEGNGVVMLAQSLGDVLADSAQASGILRIPCIAITRRTRLVEATQAPTFVCPSSRPG